MSISSPGGESKDVYEPFYAGILHHLKAIAAFTYSNPASYERVRDGWWAGGTWITWGTQNREAPLRKIDGSHWELKCVDGLANPYLAMSAILLAGLDGVRSQTPLRWSDCTEEPHTLSDEEREQFGVTEKFPASLTEAFAALRKDTTLRGLLGEELVDRYLAVKEIETEFLGTMNSEARRQWLIERY